MNVLLTFQLVNFNSQKKKKKKKKKKTLILLSVIQVEQKHISKIKVSERFNIKPTSYADIMSEKEIWGQVSKTNHVANSHTRFDIYINQTEAIAVDSL